MTLVFVIKRDLPQSTGIVLQALTVSGSTTVQSTLPILASAAKVRYEVLPAIMRCLPRVKRIGEE